MHNHLFESTYIMVFKNPRDQSQIRHPACQMFLSKPWTKFLQAAYEEETKDTDRYLFLYFHPNSPEFARVRGNVFPYDLLEEPCCLLSPKRHANQDEYYNHITATVNLRI